MDSDGAAWARLDIDAAIDTALGLTVPLYDGARLHISASPGAVVVDGDSGTSRATPQALAEEMVAVVMRQLRLRRLGGPMVIDFPRLTQDGQRHIHAMMRDAARLDPAKPALHGLPAAGFTPWRGPGN